MHLLHRIAALAVATLPAFAQETYWIANRASSDIMQISAWGSVMNRIAMPSTLRSAHVAPDGKVWVVRYIQGTFDIVDPSTNPPTITNVLATLGNPFDIAFDAQGDAWISGGTGVRRFSPNGTLIQSFPTNSGALGITIDSAGNKWIAHNVGTAAVTRIDANGVVTSLTLAGVPTRNRLIADYRGLLAPSHIWGVGDGSSQLIELDDQGVLLNSYTLPITSIGSVVFDKNGDIWVASYGNGALLRIDRTTGGVLNTYSVPPNVLGLSVDSFGRILAAVRVTFSGVGPPCEVRRIDPATGAVEVPTMLQFGAFSSIGTQTAVSTPYQYSMVVSQVGDLDGDGDVNYLEILNGTSPIDRWSSSTFSINTTGITSIGNTALFDAQSAPTSFWLLTFSFGLVAPGSGITLPGFGGEMLLDPVLGLGATVSGLGPNILPLAIPNDPTYQGMEIFTQGFVAAGPVVQFTNVSGVKFW